MTENETDPEEDEDERPSRPPEPAKTDEPATQPSRTMSLMFLLAPVMAVIVIAVVLVNRQPRRTRPMPVQTGLHLYLRAPDEPEDRALRIDVDVAGDTEKKP